MTYSFRHKSNIKNRVLTILLLFVFVIGGGVAALVLTSNSPKEAYFLAEKETFNILNEALSDRYKEEIHWNELQQTKPTEQTITVGADFSLPQTTEPNASFNPAQLLSHSALTITAQTDLEQEKMAVDLQLNVAGMKVEGFQLYLNEEMMNMNFPFMDETVQLQYEDTGTVLHQLDPLIFTGEETFEFGDLFGKNAVEGTQYLHKYGALLYEKLPEEAFTLTDETIDLNGNSINTEKIELRLTEKQVIDVFTYLLQQMKEDEAFKQWAEKQFSSLYAADGKKTDMDTVLEEWLQMLPNWKMPEGFTSTIWTKDNLIVKRKLQFEYAPETKQYLYLTLEGTQNWTKEEQTMDYVFDFGDAYSVGTIELNGSLSWKEGKAEDDMQMQFGPYLLAYQGEEKSTDGEKEFVRNFTIEDGNTSQTLSWEGTAHYDADRMEGEYTIAMKDNKTEQQWFGITVDQKAKEISEVVIPSFPNTIDIGNMEPEERKEFWEKDFMAKFQQWIFNHLTGSSF